MLEKTNFEQGLAWPKPGVPSYPSAPLTLTLQKRWEEAPNVTSFYFKVTRSDGQPFKHHPGQALSVTLPMGGNDNLDQQATRTFTIASAPTKGGDVVLSVKRNENGNATKWMHEKLMVGMVIQGRGPFGQFSLVHAPGQPLLFLGAGSGITPLMSMARWLRARDERTDVIFVQQARHYHDVLFESEIDDMADAMANFQHHIVLSKDAKEPRRLSASLLAQLAPDAVNRQVFCCGPAGFMQSAAAFFHELGGAQADFHTESFGGTTAPLKQQLEIEPGTLFSANLNGKSFDISAKENVLDAAGRAGVIIPSGCREGVCGTCRLKLTNGSVEMDNGGGLSQQEEYQGYILACCSAPRSNLILER